MHRVGGTTQTELNSAAEFCKIFVT